MSTRINSRPVVLIGKTSRLLLLPVVWAAISCGVATEATAACVVNAAQFISMRSAPGGGKVIQTIATGQCSVIVASSCKKKTGWCSATFNGQKGFVNMSFIK